MVRSLGRSVINMYSMGACAAVGIMDQDALSDDLEENQAQQEPQQVTTKEPKKY